MTSFASARATQVFVTLTAATIIREQRLFCSARMEVRLLFESGY